MINTAVYGHSKEEPSVLRTLVDTGACCTLITLSIFAELIKGTQASVTYKMYGNSSITVSVADDTSMVVLGHVAFNLHLSKLITWSYMLALSLNWQPESISYLVCHLCDRWAPSSTRGIQTTHHMALFAFMKLEP